MNRRTFIKLTGATAVVVTTGISIAKTSEPQWINFTEQMPKEGQKVALFTRFWNNKNQNISLGEVIDRSMARRYFHYPEDLVAIDIGLSYSPNRESYYGDNDLIIHGSYRPVEFIKPFHDMPKKEYWMGDIKAAVEKASWIKDKTIRYDLRRCVAPRHGKKVSEYVGRDVAYWFPITEDIPVNLPALPEPKPVNIEYRCGLNDSRTMLIKA